MEVSGDRNSRLFLRGRNSVDEGRKHDAVGPFVIYLFIIAFIKILIL